MDRYGFGILRKGRKVQLFTGEKKYGTSNSSMALQPMAQENAIPTMPSLGTRRKVQTVRTEVWINVPSTVTRIFPMPRKKPRIPLVRAGKR